MRVWRTLCIAALLATAHVNGQSCRAEDFSVMYEGQAYLTVSSLNGSTTITGPLLVGGIATFANGASVAGSTSLSGPLTATGATNLNGPVTATGPATFTGVMTSTAGVTITSGGLLMTTGNNLQVGGTATVSGVLAATGGLTTTTLSTSGLATLSSLSVTGTSTLAGVLSATGGLSTTTLSTSGLATLSSLAVTGTATIGGALSANGGTSTTTLSTSGLATVSSLAVGTTATITGVLTANGGISTTTLSTSGAATLSSLSVTGAASVGSTATFNGNVGVRTAPSYPLHVVVPGANSGWDAFTVSSTNMWGGDGNQYVTIGAGNGGIMLKEPHAVWTGAMAGIHFGRSGGTPSGAYHSMGTGASNAFFISRNGTSTLLSINAAGTTTVGGLIASSCACGAFSGEATTQPTIYYSTPPALRFSTTANTHGVVYYTGESLVFTPSWTGRYRVHLRQLFYSQNNQPQYFWFGLSTSSSSWSQAVPGMQPHDVCTLWTTISVESYINLNAGTTYSWYVMFSTWTGATAGTQIANAVTDGRQYSNLFAVAA